MKALLFGSIGVFCDSSDTQRQAYNQAFAEAGLAWHWDSESYRELLAIPGGAARLERFAKHSGKSVDLDFTAIHQRKTEVYADKLKDASQPLRSGVVRLIKEARQRGVATGWVTSTEQKNLDAILQASDGALSAADFDVITNRKTVDATKPDPAPYLKAMNELAVAAADALAIEDTAACMESALKAGLACIVTPHQYSTDQDFEQATAVVNSLGDEHAVARQIAGLPIVNDQGLVTLDALSDLTSRQSAA